MAIEYTPQDSSPPVTAIDYDPQNTSGLVSDPAEGGSFSASNEAELAGAQSFAAKAKEAQNAAEQSETNAATSAANALASETNAATSAANALASETNAATSAANALASATAAQNLQISSASFDTADGTLTLTKANSGTVTTDLDGRYAELTGATFTGDVLFSDGVKAKFGTDSDLLIYHNDGEPSVIEDAGELGLVLKTNGNIFAVASDTNENMITAVPDGGVTLYYDGISKLSVGENLVSVDEHLTLSSGNDLNVLGGELTVTGNAEAELFKGDLEGAVHFKATVPTGTIVTKGDVVYVSGHSGQKTEVDLADASDTSKMPAFGIVAGGTTGGNTNNVDVVTFGTLKSIDTSTYTDGDELYVDTTAGGLTATAPSGEGNLVQKIAKVVRADNSGNIKVMGAGRTNATPNLNDGNIFIGDSNNLATTASFATQVASAETSHADVVVDGDFASEGLMKRDATSGSYSIVTDNSGNWDAAYGWDDHSTQGYLTSFDITTQTDPKYLRADADDTTTGTITADGGFSTSTGNFATVTGNITSSYGGLTVGGLVNAPNVDISKTGSVTTNISTGQDSLSNNTKVLNLGTGYTGGTTTINMGGVHPNTTNTINIGQNSNSTINLSGTLAADNLDISTAGSVTTNIATGGTGNTTDVKVVNIGTGYGSGFFAGLSTTINMGSQSSSAKNIFNLGSGVSVSGREDTINLKGNVNVDGTIEGRDVATDGTKLDTIPYHRVRYEKLRYHNASVTLTTSYQNISQTPEIYSPTTSVKCSRYIDFQTEIEWKYISSTNNDLKFKLEVTVPTSNATVTTLGTATAGTFSGYSISGFEGWFYVSGDFTHHLTAFGRMNKTGTSGATEVPARAWQYDAVNNRTYILTDSNPSYFVSTGDTMYWHPYAWESAGTTLFAEDTLSERYVGTGSRQNITLRFKTAYDNNQLKYKAYLKELLSTDSAVVRGGEATLTEVGEV